MESTASYWCHRCCLFVRISSRDAIACPLCDGGFIEQIDNHPRADSRRVRSSRFPSVMRYPYTSSSSASTNLRPSRRTGGDRSDFNQLIVLRGEGDATSSSESTSTTGGENSNVEQNRRGFELYHDDGGESGLRPLPASTSEILLASGFDRFIDQLSQVGIQGNGRREHHPASKTAVESLPTVKINETHVHDELCCAVCKEQFELGTKVLNMPCNHLYHSNCILPWLKLRNSCPVCRHELPAETSGGDSNSPAVGLTIWRLPDGGLAVGRFAGGRRVGGGGGGGEEENREFPGFYTEMDGGFNGVRLTRRVARESGGRERGGFWGRMMRNLVGFFGWSSSSSSSSSARLHSRISRRNSGSVLPLNASSSSSRRRRGWAIEMDHERRRRW